MTGSPVEWGARGRKFESCRPDQFHINDLAADYEKNWPFGVVFCHKTRPRRKPQNSAILFAALSDAVASLWQGESCFQF